MTINDELADALRRLHEARKAHRADPGSIEKFKRTYEAQAKVGSAVDRFFASPPCTRGTESK